MSADPPPAQGFDAICEFLAAFDHPATGHAREALTAEQRTRIEALAEGKLSSAERNELLPLLSKNATALEYLATLLKSGEAGNAER